MGSTLCVYYTKKDGQRFDVTDYAELEWDFNTMTGCAEYKLSINMDAFYPQLPFVPDGILIDFFPKEGEEDDGS